MKILYIHQYFKTPYEPGGTRSYWIAKELIKEGHEVTMLTSSSSNLEKLTKIKIDGINVIYIKEDYDQNMNFFKRLNAFVNFMYKSSLIALKDKDVNLVIATSTPLTIGIPALVMKWFRKINFVFEVRDLWPEVPIQMRAIKNPILIWLTKELEKLIYKHAIHVIALSPGMQDGVVKYISKTKTTMIPNMAKIDEFWPREYNNELISELGLKEDSFKIVHFGSLGLANGAHTIIESAKILKDDPTVEFVFVGGGSTEGDLIKECEKFGLTNVKFLGQFPMKEVSEIVNLCDVSIVSFMDLPILYTNSPNKLFDSLSAGKPIIVNSAGWTKNLVEEHNCGFYVNPNVPEELVEKIKFLQDNIDVRMGMGLASRALALEKFDKTILCKEFINVISSYNV